MMNNFFFAIIATLFAVSFAQDKFENDVGLLCYPSQVAIGEPVNVNIWYTLTHEKAVDIHLNLLNLNTKLYYGGQIIPVDGQRGEVTASFVLPENVEEPFMWKVYLTPRDEPFPNFIDGKGADKQGVSETGMLIPLGATVEGQCEDIGRNSYTPNLRSPNSYVEIIEKPKTFNDGEDITLGVQTFSAIGPAEVTMTLMKQGENEVITSTTVQVEGGLNEQMISLPTPAGKENYNVLYRNDVTDVEYPVYVIVYMTPLGGNWEDSVGSDRVYSIVLN